MARNEWHRTARTPTRRHVLALTGALLLGSRFARAQDTPAVSDWSAGDHARVRLVDAGPAPQGGGDRLAGIELELDPGYLTYWRSPGEAGLPPTFSFAGSVNLKTAAVLFPAPGRYSEGGQEALGYKDGVVFPVRVVPADATQPVALKLAMDFGICERLCLPAKAEVALTLDGSGSGPEGGAVRDAMAHLPVQAQVGAAGPLAILSVSGRAGDDALQVKVRSDGRDVPLLFAEAADPWFVQAGEGLWNSDGTLTYPVRVLAKPADPLPLGLRLTLVGVDGAIEVPVTLDAPAPKP